MLTPILIGLGALVTSFVVSAAFKSAVNGISNAINRAKENKLNKQKEKKNRKKQNNKTNKNVIPEKDNVKDKTITVDNAKETIQRYIDTSREVLNADFNSLTSNKIKSLPFITVFNKQDENEKNEVFFRAVRRSAENKINSNIKIAESLIKDLDEGKDPSAVLESMPDFVNAQDFVGNSDQLLEDTAKKYESYIYAVEKKNDILAQYPQSDLTTLTVANEIDEVYKNSQIYDKISDPSISVEQFENDVDSLVAALEEYRLPLYDDEQENDKTIDEQVNEYFEECNKIINEIDFYGLVDKKINNMPDLLNKYNVTDEYKEHAAIVMKKDYILGFNNFENEIKKLVKNKDSEKDPLEIIRNFPTAEAFVNNNDVTIELTIAKCDVSNNLIDKVENSIKNGELEIPDDEETLKNINQRMMELDDMIFDSKISLEEYKKNIKEFEGNLNKYKVEVSENDVEEQEEVTDEEVEETVETVDEYQNEEKSLETIREEKREFVKYRVDFIGKKIGDNGESIEQMIDSLISRYNVAEENISSVKFALTKAWDEVVESQTNYINRNLMTRLDVAKTEEELNSIDFNVNELRSLSQWCESIGGAHTVIERTEEKNRLYSEAYEIVRKITNELNPLGKVDTAIVSGRLNILQAKITSSDQTIEIFQSDLNETILDIYNDCKNLVARHDLGKLTKKVENMSAIELANLANKYNEFQKKNDAVISYLQELVEENTRNIDEVEKKVGKKVSHVEDMVDAVSKKTYEVEQRSNRGMKHLGDLVSKVNSNKTELDQRIEANIERISQLEQSFEEEKQFETNFKLELLDMIKNHVDGETLKNILDGYKNSIDGIVKKTVSGELLKINLLLDTLSKQSAENAKQIEEFKQSIDKEIVDRFRAIENSIKQSVEKMSKDNENKFKEFEKLLKQKITEISNDLNKSLSDFVKTETFLELSKRVEELEKVINNVDDHARGLIEEELKSVKETLTDFIKRSLAIRCGKKFKALEENQKEMIAQAIKEIDFEKLEADQIDKLIDIIVDKIIISKK